MIRKAIFLVALLSAAPALAFDERIRTLAYDQDQVVRIVGRTGIQSTIEFAPDERIENIAVGDAAAWQVTPNKRARLVFLKPLVASSRTNMTVVTDKRTYFFDLVAGGRETAPVYALKFSYTDLEPEMPPPPQTAPVIAAAQGIDTVALLPHRLNFEWKTKGASKLMPQRIFDDGSSLYLAWDHSRPLPAILTVAEDRREGTLNYRVAGDYIVISPVPANILLRYGKQSVSAWQLQPIYQAAPAASPPYLPAHPTPAQQYSDPAPSTIAAAPQKNVVIPPAAPIQVTTAASNAHTQLLKLPDLALLMSDKVTGGGDGH